MFGMSENEATRRLVKCGFEQSNAEAISESFGERGDSIGLAQFVRFWESLYDDRKEYAQEDRS